MYVGQKYNFKFKQRDNNCKLLPLCNVGGARFLREGVLECIIEHRRSVAVLRMLYKIRCNPMHPLYGALPVPYVAVRVTRGALVAHLYAFAPPCWRTSQYRRTFPTLSVSEGGKPITLSLCNEPIDTECDSVGLMGFKTRANAFSWPMRLSPILL